MKITYCTWTRVGDSLKVVRRSYTKQGALKGFRPGKPIITFSVHKS